MPRALKDRIGFIVSTFTTRRQSSSRPDGFRQELRRVEKDRIDHGRGLRDPIEGEAAVRRHVRSYFFSDSYTT